jgi:hypothetical protein
MIRRRRRHRRRRSNTSVQETWFPSSRSVLVSTVRRRNREGLCYKTAKICSCSRRAMGSLNPFSRQQSTVYSRSLPTVATQHTTDSCPAHPPVPSQLPPESALLLFVQVMQNQSNVFFFTVLVVQSVLVFVILPYEWSFTFKHELFCVNRLGCWALYTLHKKK